MRGDGEAAIAALVAGASLDAVPNLTWREGAAIVERPLSYVAGSADFDRLDYAATYLMRHAGSYSSRWSFDLRTDAAASYSAHPIFYLAPGRGCTLDCAFCAGSRSSMRASTGRDGVVWRAPARVVDDIERLTRQGIEDYCICFDPPTSATSERTYYARLFAELRRRCLRPGMIFECYTPPTEAFLDDFAATFAAERSQIALSPTTADEAQRRHVLGAHFTNAEVDAAVAAAHERRLRSTLYFSVLPAESWESIEHTALWQRSLMQRFDSQVLTLPLEIEPEAPWHRDPEAYGLRHARKSFAELLDRHQKVTSVGVDYGAELGYRCDEIDAKVLAMRSAHPDAAQRADMERGGACPGRRCVIATPQHAVAAAALAAEPAIDLSLFVVGEMDAATRRAVLRGAKAANRLCDQLHEIATCRPTVACRQAPALCPGARLAQLWVDTRGGVRPCPPAPILGSLQSDLATLRDRMGEAVTKTEEERGCATCAVRDACSRCPFPGVSSAEFCAARRA